MSWIKTWFNLDCFTTSLVLTNLWFCIMATILLKYLFVENQFTVDIKFGWFCANNGYPHKLEIYAGKQTNETVPLGTRDS